MVKLTLPFASAGPRGWLVSKLAFALPAVALGDWLFYGEPLGASLPLFLAVIAGVATAANRIKAGRSERIIAGIALLVALLPLLEDAGLLSFCFGVLGTAGFAILLTSDRDAPVAAQVRRLLLLPLCGAPWLIGDGIRATRLIRRKGFQTIRLGSLMVGVVPVTLFVVFLTLFRAANPLIEDALAAIDPGPLLTLAQPARCLFWVVMLCAIWPLLHLRRMRRRQASAAKPAEKRVADPTLDTLFGERSIVASLVSCNVLFAVQTLLDGAFLWGGFGLPEGMSYATYAHRGAYPLIVTALLAAAFVLVAMRAGGPAQKSALIRPLVLIWTVQNVWLVVSSILRLDLYVAAYSLTGLRVSAFIWMILVLIGLLLIIEQIAHKRSNRWLVAANAISLAVVFYATCFLDFPYLIADYNVAHSSELNGTGPKLDLPYLISLGPQVIPALDRLPKAVLTADGAPACDLADLWYAAQAAGGDDWRAWSFRNWRLQRYLSSNTGAVKESIGLSH